MLIEQITPTLIRKCLNAFSHYKRPPALLLTLHCLEETRSPAEQAIALRRFMVELVKAQLIRLRPAGTNGGPISFSSRHTGLDERQAVLEQLAQDFRVQSGELEAWSSLCHKYLAEFLFSPSELSQAAGVTERTFRRRVQEGVSYLTGLLRQEEDKAHLLSYHTAPFEPKGKFDPLAHSEIERFLPQSPGIYYDDFSSYPQGAPPAGWTVRGRADITPTIERVDGLRQPDQVVNFPDFPWQYEDKWLIRDGLVMHGSYTVTVRLSFQEKKADRAGLTLAWNELTSDHIDVQPNIYWEHIEFHVKYGGPNPSHLLIAATKRLSLSEFTDYWLRVVAKDEGPGQGQVNVYWSEDGSVFDQALLVTGVPDLTGMCGISTAGPHLPHTHFVSFKAEW